MEGKTPEEMAQKINESISAIKTDLSNAVTKEQLKEVETKLEGISLLATKESVSNLDGILKELKEGKCFLGRC